MKLLVTAQTLDESDPVLGFFVAWVKELAQHHESIEVVCLFEGTHTLPRNVQVHSLGKEKKRQSQFVYAYRYLRLVWVLRKRYEAVFVHMNQEYILVAGWYWKLAKKNIYLWRNHYAGSILTDVAVKFCKNVFYTSKHSFTAKYPNAKKMPVGVNLVHYISKGIEERVPRSILFLARMAPSKRPDILLEALALLKKEQIPFTATLAGSPLSEDARFYSRVQARSSSLGLDDIVTFIPGPPPADAPPLFRRAELFVNCSRSGMFDKTLFEASACGALVLAMSDDFAVLTEGASFFDTPESLAKKIKEFLALSQEEHTKLQTLYKDIASKQSLTELAIELKQAIL